MVHTLQYKYKGTNYYFLWDVESGSLHNVDYVAFLCAKEKYNKDFSINEKKDFEKINKTDKIEIFSEFNEMEKEGELNTPSMVKDFQKTATIVKALCLNICHDCNMRCDYCFAKGGSYNTPRDYMSFEVGKKSVDFLIKNSGSRHNLEIDFFGGEPLMNLDVVKQVVEYAKGEAKKYEKKFEFTLTTNCVLLDKDTREYLNKEMINIVLSIDGRENTHNYVRHSVDGKNIYKKILNNAIEMRKIRGDKQYYARGTFTAKNLDFANDIIALNDAGFDQISMEPVVTVETSPLAIKEEHLPSIMKEYDRLATIYMDRRKTEKWFSFFHFVADLETGPCVNKRMTGCGSGTEYLSVSPTGEIYPCHQFVGQEKFVLGNVFEGLKRQDIREKFACVSVMSKPNCQDCFAKYYCGGGCMANAYYYADGINGQYKIGCEMTRKRFELCLAIDGIEKLEQMKKQEDLSETN